MINCKKIKFRDLGDQRGDLIAIENLKDIPFEIKRIYYIFNVGNGVERGFHSHRDLEQVLIALNGKIKIRLKTDSCEEIVELNKENEGLYIGPMIWREMFDFEKGATLLTLASHEYDESDYIRNYKLYLEEAKTYFDKLKSIQKYLDGKETKLKLVEEKDAEFLLSLRQNENLNKFLSPTNPSVEEQVKWIEKYKYRELNQKEYYFKILSSFDADLGFVRLYNYCKEQKEITFGSFILSENKPRYAALEAMVLSTKFAFDYIGVDKIVLDVRVANEHAKKLYQRFGYVKTDENELDEFYELKSKDFSKKYKEEYKKYVK